MLIYPFSRSREKRRSAVSKSRSRSPPRSDKMSLFCGQQGCSVDVLYESEIIMYQSETFSILCITDLCGNQCEAVNVTPGRKKRS